MMCPAADWWQYTNLSDPYAVKILHKKGTAPPCDLKLFCTTSSIPYKSNQPQPPCPPTPSLVKTPVPTAATTTATSTTPAQCTASEDYECDRGIASAYDLGTKLALATWSQCRDECLKNVECQAWTFEPDGGCALKKQNITRSQKGYRSGGRSKTCTNPENQAYYCDRTIASQYDVGPPTKKTTWQECRDMSAADAANCFGWTYNPDGICQKKTTDEMKVQRLCFWGLRKSFWRRRWGNDDQRRHLSTHFNNSPHNPLVGLRKPTTLCYSRCGYHGPRSNHLRL